MWLVCEGESRKLKDDGYWCGSLLESCSCSLLSYQTAVCSNYCEQRTIFGFVMFFCCGPKITPPSLPVIIRYYALLTATLLGHQSSSGLISRLIGSRLDTIISDCILQMRYQLLLFILTTDRCQLLQYGHILQQRLQTITMHLMKINFKFTVFLWKLPSQYHI